MDTAARHTPVLLERCLDLLAPSLVNQDAVLVDATLGMGGHTEAALTRFQNVRVVGIDRDPEAIAMASARLSHFGDRFTAVHAVYDEIPVVLEELGIGLVEAILMDLGVSSLQLDEEYRGFSYSADAPLDMRMDPTVGPDATAVLSTYDVDELTRIFREYGEERFARRIAGAIVRRRQETPLTRTSELVDLVRRSIPAASRATGGHPAKRTFQALRIEVNRELDILSRAIPRAIGHLTVGGRIVVESYQSLEDRIVKRAFAAGATSSVPRGLPIELEGMSPYLRLITKGAEKADDSELVGNPRSASVRLRAAERIRLTEGVIP